MEDDYTYQFNTSLTPDEEILFRRWAEQQRRLSDLRDYDLRGAWKARVAQGDNGHLPDTYKKPNHPTFSAESQYSRGDMVGGRWEEGEGGKWVFWASPHNVRNYGVDGLQAYFRDNEPDASLILQQGAIDPMNELDRIFSPRIANNTALRYQNTR